MEQNGRRQPWMENVVWTEKEQEKVGETGKRQPLKEKVR